MTRTNDNIPFIILISQPDYKRPSTSVINGKFTEQNFDEGIARIIAGIMNQNEFGESYKSFDDFYHNFYNNHGNYMDNNPIEIHYIINDEWEILDFNDELKNKIFAKYKESFIN